MGMHTVYGRSFARRVTGNNVMCPRFSDGKQTLEMEIVGRAVTRKRDAKTGNKINFNRFFFFFTLPF